ncbi:MAG TPA: SpoIIE family protein phosphatase [Thermoleophilaceae bacterium]|nr:SpoIIE family protein phosphatase [Thermoleophilaceae bacterium]
MPQPESPRRDRRGDRGVPLSDRALTPGDGREPAAPLRSSAEDLYEDAPCGYLSALPDGTVVRANRTLLAWTGHSREEIVGRRFADLLSPGGRMYHETHYAPLLAMQGAVREIALEIVRADGGRMPVLVNSTLHRDAAGAPVEIRTAVFGVADRREYERELLRARDREQEARERAEVLQRTMGRLAAENADLYARERRVARTLQASLLAGEPPRDERFAVATHYSPAGDTLEVGGDWHDAIRLDEDRIAIVVGDVVGRGLDAAATMGQLRSAILALAGTRLSPARLLDQLDTFVDQVASAWMGTVLYAEVDLTGGEVRYASAGHPPPLLIQPGERPRPLWGGRSTPLGAGRDATRDDDAVALRPGGRLLLFTDGLVERRDRSVDDGLEQLVDEVATRRAAPLSQLAEELALTMTAGGSGEDDVCLLAFELARA